MPRERSTSNGCIWTTLLRPPRPMTRPTWSRQVAKLEVVEWLRSNHQIRGALADFRVDEAECLVSFKGPSYAADAFIDRESGHYRLTETYHGFIAAHQRPAQGARYRAGLVGVD